MREKVKLERRKHSWPSAYFKPHGKYEKRQIHKKLRRMPGTFRPGIMNAIGVNWDWS